MYGGSGYLNERLNLKRLDELARGGGREVTAAAAVAVGAQTA